MRSDERIAEGAGDEAATVYREAAEILHGAAYLLALRRGEALHGLGMLDDTAALLIGHVVELGEAIKHSLLSLGRELAEAGFVLERGLLLLERELAVTIHPLGQMLLAPPWTDMRATGNA
jgi:hypothetical protein